LGSRRRENERRKKTDSPAHYHHSAFLPSMLDATRAIGLRF
jgi:hypothetical protein